MIILFWWFLRNLGLEIRVFHFSKISELGNGEKIQAAYDHIKLKCAKKWFYGPSYSFAQGFLFIKWFHKGINLKFKIKLFIH